MPSSSQSVSIHALVVDDDPNVRGIVVRLLTRQFEDLRVTEATNGLEALDTLARERFTIALLDLTMPVMDGMDVLETIRRDPALRGMPVVMLTGRNDAVTVKRIMDLGVTDFVLKPIHPAAFLERVGRVLSKESLAAGGDSNRTGFSPMELTPTTSVLVADGSEELRQLVQRVMAPMCRVQTVASGLEAFRYCLESPPQAVFLGSDLGVLRSEVLARKIRQHPRLRGVRLIGIEPQRTLLQARKRGTLDAVILQSFVPEVFMEGLKSLLARPGHPSRLMSSVPDLKLLAISAGEEALSAVLGQHVVLRPQQTDRKKPLVSATRCLDTGPEGSPLLVTLSAPARKLADVAEQRSAGQPAEALLEALLERLVQTVAGELGKRGLDVSYDTPSQSRPRPNTAQASVGPNSDDTITVDFDVPAAKLTLTVDLTDADRADRPATSPRARTADVA
jgi:CheY-like chemotaxis protein